MLLKQKKSIGELRKILIKKIPEAKDLSDKEIPGRMLSSLREEQKLTYRELAKELGFGKKKPDTSRLSKYQAGILKPSRTTLYKLFIVLNVETNIANLILESYGMSPMISQECQRLIQIQMSSRMPPRSILTRNDIKYLESGRYENTKPLIHLATKYREKSMFKVGNVLFHCSRLVGGDGRINYKWPNGIKVKVDNKPYFTLPDDISKYEQHLLNIKKKDADQNRLPFTDRLKVRLQNWNFQLKDEDESPWPLQLYVQPTTFFKRAVTNASLDIVLPTGISLRMMEYANHPDDFETSILANVIAVNLMVVTTDDWSVHYAKRGSRVADHPGGYAPAVSGTANWDDDKTNNIFNPFETAKREFNEELTEDLDIRYEDINFYGLARIFHTFDPFLFGTILINNIDSKEFSNLVQTNRDSYDVEYINSCKINNIGETIEKIKKLINDAEIQPEIPHGTFSTIFGLYMSLIYLNPDKKREINKRFLNI